MKKIRLGETYETYNRNFPKVVIISNEYCINGPYCVCVLNEKTNVWIESFTTDSLSDARAFAGLLLKGEE